MTVQEASTLVLLAVANWPQMQDKDMSATARLWATMLADIPYETAKQALIKVLATARYFPTVAEIREAVLDLTRGKDLTAEEAWGIVTRAVRWYGYYREREALASLPDEVREIVEHFGWREICSCDDTEVVRAQFRMAWEARVRKTREIAVLPPAIRVRVIELSERRGLPGSGEELAKGLPPAAGGEAR